MNIQVVLEDSESKNDYLRLKSEQGSNTEGSHPAEDQPPLEMKGTLRNSSLTQGYDGWDLRLCLDLHCL